MNILNEIIVNERRNVVEFGSGISTLYIARILSEQGGRLITIEDNAEWAALVERMLEREGLRDVVTLVRAPLKPCSFSVNGLEWYNEKAVEDALGDVKIDMVLVDGPPAYEKGKELSRYPAFRAVVPHLNERCAIILDDIDRPGERQALARWQAQADFDLDVDVQVIPNFALCRRGPCFNSGF
jgi:predicted O-methyltransferase YrrM